MADQILSFVAQETDEGSRLDMAIATKFPTISRSVAQKTVKNQGVLVNGRPKPPGFRLQEGMTVEITLPEQAETKPVAAETGGGAIDILWEDEFLMVINKKAGLVVHPGAGHGSGTLVNILLASGRSFSTIGGEDRPGLVHRLDKDTSGVMVIAKDNLTHEKLSDQFKDRVIQKTYLAIVLGPRINDRGIIETSFGRRSGDRKQFTGKVQDGKPAVTEYETLLRANLCALVAAFPKTGRTHQIRVHFAEAGHPIVGDHIYGRAHPKRGSLPASEVEALEIMKRHALHAWRIEFNHPVTGERISVKAPVPGDFRRTLDALFAEEWREVLETM